MVRHSLREFHHYPLVSYGKNAAGLWRGSRRVPPELAWTYPELELGRTANSIPALLFDLDGHPPDWRVEVFRPPFPVPNWLTFRRANQHAHLVYALARPVLRGAQARPTPQGWLARIGEYLAVKLQADAAYSSILAHNPMSRASRGRYRTDWLRPEPYSLAELAGYIPQGWRRPRQPQTVAAVPGMGPGGMDVAGGDLADGRGHGRRRGQSAARLADVAEQDAVARWAALLTDAAAEAQEREEQARERARQAREQERQRERERERDADLEWER